jgi:hypothetical protein
MSRSGGGGRLSVGGVLGRLELSGGGAEALGLELKLRELGAATTLRAESALRSASGAAGSAVAMGTVTTVLGLVGVDEACGLLGARVAGGEAVGLRLEGGLGAAVLGADGEALGADGTGRGALDAVSSSLLEEAAGAPFDALMARGVVVSLSPVLGAALGEIATGGAAVAVTGAVVGAVAAGVTGAVVGAVAAGVTGAVVGAVAVAVTGAVVGAVAAAVTVA